MNKTSADQTAMGSDPRRGAIEAAYAASVRPSSPSSPSSPRENTLCAVEAEIQSVIADLDAGRLRVAEPTDAGWVVHGWVMQAISLYFSISPMKTHTVGPFEYRDKIPCKSNLEAAGVRVVPPGTARFGSFLEPGVVLMPGYVNIGAYIGSGTMIDTWATVGSSAQIGRNVHLSGGVGIGGVLEPPGAQPVIVEDGAFVGSRCVVVEGVRVGYEAVLGANVVLTASTPIIDVTGSTERVCPRGYIPPRAVVVPGMRPRTFAAGTYHLPCALVIGERSASTDRKTSLNAVLRDFDIEM